MASESGDDPTVSQNASSEDGAGNSASDDVVKKDENASSDPTDPTDPTEKSDKNPDASGEQLALPGLPATPAVDPTEEVDPHHDDPDHQGEHHDEYDDPYHNDYHEEHYHHDDPEHNDEHHDGYHKDDPNNNYNYHDDHYQPPQRAYAAGSTLPARDNRPLDQRSFPDGGEEEVDVDEDGNPYGGPVKPFLDHLEDLRWMLLKCLVTLLIAMLGCMMGAKQLVSFLTYPLEQAAKLSMTKRTDIPVRLGKHQIGKIPIAEFGKLGIDTNAPAFAAKEWVFTIAPVQVGTNFVMGLERKTKRNPGDKSLAAMVDLKNYGPFESIWLCLQLALYGGLVIGAPFIIFFVAQFVLPALKVAEKAFLYKITGIGSVLFFVGVAFCYFLIVMVALRASVEFSNWMGFGADEWKAGEYINFVVKFLLVMGVAFELPVVVLTIVKIGLIDYKQLTEFRSYCIVGMLVAAAVITPSGDPFTMVLVAFPLWILYEICVIIARMWYKQDKALEAAEAAKNP
jgi:sec-independent protein translocase protein TatC